jgi:hypothetical protein
MGRLTKKAVSILTPTEIRCVAVKAMGLSTTDAWRMKPGDLVDWVCKNKEALTEENVEKLGVLADKFRPGIADYVSGLSRFVLGTIGVHPTWDGELGIASSYEDGDEGEDEDSDESETTYDRDGVAIPPAAAEDAEDEQEPDPEPVVEKKLPKPPKVSALKKATVTKTATAEAQPSAQKVLKPALKLVAQAAGGAPAHDLEEIKSAIMHMAKDIDDLKASIAELTAAKPKVDPGVEKLTTAVIAMANALFESEITSLDDLV